MGETVAEVMLTGGGAQLSGLAQSLSEMIHIPVTLADPFKLMTLSRQLKDKKLQESEASISVALALALRSQ
jgi:type IV pilus assembly protein PilM